MVNELNSRVNITRNDTDKTQSGEVVFRGRYKRCDLGDFWVHPTHTWVNKYHTCQGYTTQLVKSLVHFTQVTYKDRNIQEILMC